MGVLMAEADKVRLETLRRIVEVLTPVQAAEFLLSGKRLHMSLREWGRAREERRYGCVHVRMQQQGEPEPGSQRDRTLLIWQKTDIYEVLCVLLVLLLHIFRPRLSLTPKRSKRRETTKDDNSPHGVSSGVCRLLRQKTDRNQHGRRLSRSSWCLLRLLSSSPSEDRSKPARTTTVSVLTASPPTSVIFSVRRLIETSTDDDCLGPHGVSSGFSRLLRQKTDRNPLWTTTLSVLTASPPDWRFSQVCGKRSAGEEVHEVKKSRGYTDKTEAPPHVSSRSNRYLRLWVRNYQKWSDLASSKIDGSAKKRKCEDVAQSESSQAITNLGDQPTKRPPGAKAAKGASSKRNIADHQAVSEFQTMWSIKEKDLAAIETVRNDERRRLSSRRLLWCLSSFPSEDRSKPARTTIVSVLMASPPASLVFSVRRPIETSTDDDCLGPHGVSSDFSRLLRQKTDRNPPRTTTLSVLTTSPPDWRFSQVCGKRTAGEEVHEEIEVDCVVNYGRDFCLSMDSFCLTLVELSTEAPPHVSSRSNRYLRLWVR
ncbi:hypothetical protein F2Q68_00006183 [Brassica cretica]|uniref:DOG1 domain-containing protein n=1 Tax=Brassica cretica TaxID=69181 RepID=A0A8S9JII7_BRACR|nr:hypothetical protein F2Q68_00006183 [Brassica cretica]